MTSWIQKSSACFVAFSPIPSSVDLRWFEPDHRVVRIAAPFFAKRFAGMDWSILTPYEPGFRSSRCLRGAEAGLLNAFRSAAAASLTMPPKEREALSNPCSSLSGASNFGVRDGCARWDGQRLHFTHGVPRSSAPDVDALDDHWRTYYSSIFNPARVKISPMQSEMPKKYWKNLPETPLIAEFGLIAESAGRVRRMLEAEERPAQPAPDNAYLKSLHDMNQSDVGEPIHPSEQT